MALLGEIKAEEEAVERAEREAEALRRKEYARNCGRVAKRLGISFVNVLRMGYEDEEVLKAFQASLVAAKKKLAAMKKKEREYYNHEIFACGRARLRAAVESLGIVIPEQVDVFYMDFSTLGE